MRTNKRSVLIVDDNQDILDITKDTLERMGFSVEAHTDLDKAIDYAWRAKMYLDLIITDGDFGNGRTGIEFVKEFSGRITGMPIFMQSGSDEIGEAFLKAGGHKFVHKIDHGALVAAVKNWFDM